MGSLHDLGEARLRKQHELWQRAELAMEARMAARLAQVVVADDSEFTSHEDRCREHGRALDGDREDL
jgi:hypothetical protein